jgi:two-component system, chemotaxis family, chemotaxis protein CheY
MAIDLAMPILVVEDSKTMGQIIRNLLMLIGFRKIENISDGTTALAKLREKKFGLVISDWNMQPMTGLMLLTEVRADPMLEGLVFIMVTAESTVANVVAARDAGASSYIVKPFTGEMLKSKIGEAFGSGMF